MPFSYKNLLIILSIFGALHAHDGPSANILKSNYEPADQRFQIIGKEAQETVGVEKLLPILQAKPDLTTRINALDKNICIFAYTETNKIVIVDPKLFNSLTYGMVRCILFHEAIHAKYEDPKKLFVYEEKAVPATALMFSLIPLTVLKICRVSNKYSLASAIASFLYLKNMAGKRLSKMKRREIERRADTEGFQATKCESCVREYALLIEAVEKINATNAKYVKGIGYLDAHEIHTIAKNLKGQMCPGHAHLATTK